jgi:hypothetical protein
MKDKTYFILPVIAITIYADGKKEITIGWLGKLYFLGNKKPNE